MVTHACRAAQRLLPHKLHDLAAEHSGRHFEVPIDTSLLIGGFVCEPTQVSVRLSNCVCRTALHNTWAPERRR